MDHHHKKDASLYAYPLDLDDSTLSCAYGAATTFFAFLGEWAILVVTCSIAFFFFPLSPAFTLHSTTSSLLKINGENHFTANLSVGILVDHSNPLGSSIYYDSIHFSIFQGRENLSTFSLQQQEQNKISAIEAKYPNVSVKVDEWGNDVDAVQVHGRSCGFVYLDLRFSANARYTLHPMLPPIRDKLQGHCGQVKVELCSSAGTTTVFHSFLSSCHVYSAVVHNIRLVLFLLLILLLVTAVALPFLFEHFFCSSTLYFLES